jgi:hypothetical protein
MTEPIEQLWTDSINNLWIDDKKYLWIPYEDIFTGRKTFVHKSNIFLFESEKIDYNFRTNYKEFTFETEPVIRTFVCKNVTRLYEENI